MKKSFGLRSKKDIWSFGSSINPVRDGGHRINFQPGYSIQDKDLRKIHKAASVGNVAKVQQVLLLGKNGLNDRDKMNRTALHLACANGHSAVVTLLLERKCLLDLCDNEKRTPLMKAVECQEEECATLLLEHGADPNVMDVCGNTALHYAVFCQNLSIAAKLLSYDANIEARNKDDLTPLSLAIRERRGQMVEFLVKKGANIHAIDKMKSIHQLISEYKEKKPETSPENSNPVVDESSEEDSLSRFPNKPGDLGPTSDNEALDFKTKHVLKPKLTKLMKASQHSKRNIEAQCGIFRPESTTFSEDSNSDSDTEDVAATFPKPSPWFEGISHLAFPSPEPVPKLLKSVAGLGCTKEGATKSELVAEESDTDIIDRAPQEQTNHDHLTSVDGAHKNNRSDMMSALGLGEEEDIESPWDSESISESLLQKYMDHLSGTAGEKGNKTLNGQVEDSPGKYPNVKPTVRMKDFVRNMKDLQTSGSDWASTALSFNNETCQRDLSTELDLEMISEEEQEKLDGDENNHPQVEEKKHKSSEVEVSANVYDATDESGLIQQRRSGGSSNQEFPAMENEGSDSSDPGVHRKEVKKKNNGKWTPEECVIVPIFEKTDSLTGGLHVNDDSILGEVDQDDDRSARKTPYEKKKVKEQINYMNDLDNLTQLYETVSKDGDVLYSTNSTLQVEPLDLGCKDSGSLLKIQGTVFSHERLVDFQRSHCELLRGEIHKMKSKVRGLQKELSETKEVKSQLEHQKVEWELELSSLRFTLKQEEENRRNANMSFGKIREQLKRKEDEYSKEVEMKQQLELTLRALEMELNTVRNNRNQVSAGHEEAKHLLHKNHMLQDELAMLGLEIDAMKNQNLEKEKKYSEDIEIVKAKNNDAQKAIKLNEEILSKTISQYTGQLNVLTAENTMLKSKLENEKENKQRLETEVESYHSRLAAALHDHDQGQTSQRDLELAFQKAKDEWLCLQDKMKSDVANLKDNNEALTQQISTVKSKFNQLKIKLQHMRDDLREKTLMLEHVQRDLHQAEYQKQETEHMYQNEQGKVNEYLGKQDSLEERLSQLQSENMLLRQQLDDAQNKADSKEKIVISIQDQFQQIVRKVHAESEKQSLMLEERNKELINEWNHLKDRMYWYENEKAEREAVVRQLQQELADTIKMQSMSEASLKGMSHYCTNLEAETQDLKNSLHQLTSQTQAGSQQMELRIKDLESELSKMKTLQEDSNKAELEKYKHLYLVELEVRKSLQDKLDKTDERLAEISTKLEVEKEQNKSLHSILTTRPVLEPSAVGNFNPASGFNTNLISRANIGFYTSTLCPSNDSMETYLTKMQQELDRSITRELRKVDAEFASDAFRVSPQVSADGSNVYDDQILKTKAEYTQILKEKYMI